MWLCHWQPHPSSLDPNRRKAIGVSGGGDAVGGGAQKGKLKFECVGGPVHHCQSVKQLGLRQAFPWPHTFRETRKTLWIPLWTGKAAVSSWVAALAFLSEKNLRNDIPPPFSSITIWFTRSAWSRCTFISLDLSHLLFRSYMLST